MPRVSLHSKGSGNDLSLWIGLLLIVAGIAGSGWLLFGAVQAEGDDPEIHATAVEGDGAAILLPPDTQDRLPALVGLLEEAGADEPAVMDDDDAVGRTVAFLHNETQGEDLEGDLETLPREGMVRWRGQAYQLHLRGT